MNNFWIRKISILIIIASMSIVVTSCSKGTGKETVSKVNPSENISMPISDGSLKLTMATTISGSVGGKRYEFGDIAAFQEYEKKTGVKVEYKTLTKEQLNMLIASNDLPDMINVFWSGLGGTLRYATNKQIIPLDGYLEQYAPNFTALLNKNPDIKKQLKDADGKIYYFPFVRPEKEMRVFHGFQLRKDWLDKLGLQPPTTREEFYNVLKAFKERDPNGNGLQDEIPFISTQQNGLSRFLYWWGIDFLYQEDNKVKCGYIGNEYKEALEWLNKLYKEGLIDSDYALTDSKQFDSKVFNGLSGAWYGYASSTLGRLMTQMKSVDKKFNIMGMDWLKAPDGKAYCLHKEYESSVSDLGIAITTKSKNVKEAIRWADFAYGEQGSMLINFGVEGKSYNIENGFPKFSSEITSNEKGLPMNEALTQYAYPFSYPVVQDKRYFDQYVDGIQKSAIDIWKKADITRTLPTLKFTTEENSILASTLNDINTYRDEMFNKFIMGSEPLGNYDAYVNRMKQMGIEKIIDINQKALDRYNESK